MCCATSAAKTVSKALSVQTRLLGDLASNSNNQPMSGFHDTSPGLLSRNAKGGLGSDIWIDDSPACSTPSPRIVQR